MRTANQFLRMSARAAATLAILTLLVLALAGCFEPNAVNPVPATETPIAPLPTEPVPVTPTPMPQAAVFPLPAPVHVSIEHPAHETCIACHTDGALLKESLSAAEAGAAANGGEAWAADGQTDGERWERVYLDNPVFLETVHGRYGCITCHGGTGDTMVVEVAHTGLIAEPSAAGLCEDCHVEEVSTAHSSLHASVVGYRTVILTRAGTDRSPALEAMLDNHCQHCHTATCGQCHVSRAASVGGGLVAGHMFEHTPAVNLTCAGCHGSRIDDEYQGEVGHADIHWQQEEMVCTDCHLSTEFHGTDTEHVHRYDGQPSPSCEESGCHPEVSEVDGIAQHADSHLKNLSCQACHATAYQNCYSCHVQMEDDAPSFALGSTEIGFKIGRNPIQGRYRPWKYVPVRHVPVTPESFSFYGKDLLPNFDALPTWTYATPHTIQRITPQNSDCNACHGNEDVFLTAGDVDPEELVANRRVIVDAIPAPVR